MIRMRLLPTRNALKPVLGERDEEGESLTITTSGDAGTTGDPGASGGATIGGGGQDGGTGAGGGAGGEHFPTKLPIAQDLCRICSSTAAKCTCPIER